MEKEQYQMIIHYLSLFLVLCSIAEIFVRKKGLGVREDRHRDGRVISNRLSLAPPTILLIVAIVVAYFTQPG